MYLMDILVGCMRKELTGYDGYRWSPDSKTIAFWEENQSKLMNIF